MRYKTVGILKDAGLYKDDNDYRNGVGTPYLLSRERTKFQVTVKAGLLVQGGELGFHPFDTSSNPKGSFIYVMSGDGTIYSADENEIRHHSGFLAGREVAAAGSWVVRSGRLTMITDQSGHYQPPTEYSEQILSELQSKGVNLTNVTRKWVGSDSKTTAKKLEAIGHIRHREGKYGWDNAKF